MKKLLLLTSCLVAAAMASAQAPTFKWAKKIGGTTNDYGQSIKVDASGNVYTSGLFQGTVDFDPGTGTSNLTSAGSTDVFISKLNASGNFVWAKRMGGTLNDYGASIIDASGNVYTSGWFQGTADFDPGASTYNLTSAGDSDIFISKLDDSGNFVWAKRIGGTSADGAWMLALDASGNIYTTGRFQGTVDFDPGAGTSNLTSSGNRDIFVLNLDNSGNFVWAKSMGGTSNDLGKRIAVDASGNVYTTGVFLGTADFDPDPSVTYNLTSAGGYDIFVSKLDASGNLVWANRMGGTADDASQGFVLETSGNVYTTGAFSGTADFDPGSGTYNLTAASLWDAFISKLDASGNFVWAKRMGGSCYEWGWSIALDGSGNVYSTGEFACTGDFNPGTATYNLTPAGNEDIYISKLDASGNFVWAQNIGGRSAVSIGRSIALDAYGNIYITGVFAGTVDFDFGKSKFNLSSTNAYSDVFILKLSQASGFMVASTDHNENSLTSNLSIYPNPNTGAFVIKAKTDGVYTIVNQLGQTIQTVETNSNNNYSVNISELSTGVYFIIGRNEDALIRQRIIVTK